MTTPAPPGNAERRVAFIRLLVFLLFVIAGTATATVGAGLAWGLGPALVVLGSALLLVGMFIAAVG